MRRRDEPKTNSPAQDTQTPMRPPQAQSTTKHANNADTNTGGKDRGAALCVPPLQSKRIAASGIQRCKLGVEFSSWSRQHRRQSQRQQVACTDDSPVLTAIGEAAAEAVLYIEEWKAGREDDQPNLRTRAASAKASGICRAEEERKINTDLGIGG
jgi:hypothetical protein